MAKRLKPIESYSGMTAVLYGRYSSHAQKDASIEQQFRDNRAFCEAHGITIIGEYADKHMSGTSSKRPEFQRMIRDAAKGRFQLVICWKVDRFARNREDAAIYKGRLRSHGVRVLYVKEPIPEGSAGILLETMLEGTAEWYSANLSENIRRGMNDNALQCKVNGGSRPLGYTAGPDGRYAVEPREAEIVKEIFALYTGGMSSADIIESLNARGLRTSKDAYWNKNSLRSILKNERYTGVYKYGDIVVEGGMPPLVSKEVFGRAQEIMEKNAHAPRSAANKTDYLLTAKLYCGKCKAAMVGESGRGRHGGVYHYYKCINRKLNGADACDMRTFAKEALERAVAEKILAAFMRDDVIEELADSAVSLQQQEQENTLQLDALTEQLKATERSLKNMLAAIEAGIITPSTKTRMDELEAQKAQLVLAIEDCKAQHPVLERERICYFLRQLRGGEPSDPAFQVKLFEMFLRAAYVYDDKITLICCLGDGDSSIDIPLGSYDAECEGFGFGACCSTTKHLSEPLRVYVTARCIIIAADLVL